jgi:metal-responsive CopG/Arc/MetJ family transcriptional regulator
MKSLLLSFPEFLISESDKAAVQLGVSRSEFIRQSVIHELKKLAKRTRENNIISSFDAMKKSNNYLKESTILDDGFVEEINIDEDDEWWK